MVKKVGWQIFISVGLNLMAQLAPAADSCPWVPTFGKSIAEVQKYVAEKSGKQPALSCGAGKDYKVCHSCADRLDDNQWRRIQPMLAEPSYRAWHQSWHAKSTEDAFVQAKKMPATTEDEIQGENFFFAHREMIRNVNANLAAMGLPCISPWAELPKQASDPVWPNTDAMKVRSKIAICNEAPSLKVKAENFGKDFSQGLRELQSRFEDEFKTADEIQDASESLTKKVEINNRRALAIDTLRNETLAKHGLTNEVLDNLRDCPSQEAMQAMHREQLELHGQTTQHLSGQFMNGKLGDLGESIERSWHGTLHFRYNPPVPRHCSRRSIEPECDGMGSPFSSHVNIHFYKVHGLIDQYIEKWLDVHGKEIAQVKCAPQDTKCYQWKGTYTGDLPDFVTGNGCDLKHGIRAAVAPTEPALPGKSSEPSTIVPSESGQTVQ